MADVRELILKALKARGEVRASEIVKASGFSRAYVSRFFKELVDGGKAALIGRANRARYVPATRSALAKAASGTKVFNRILRNENLQEDEVLSQVKKSTGIRSGLPGNVAVIFDYAFTEMLNNAIEHSGSENIRVTAGRKAGRVLFVVADRGIGIFRNIRRKMGLSTDLEAVQDLLKGKQTTAPDAHSGEGIFFTSKVADSLIIKSFGKELVFDNLADDVFLKDGRPVAGTVVEFLVSRGSKKDLNGVFREYTGKNHEFSRTRVTVHLYKTGTEYLSRSQARRIVAGLDKFKHVILDFRKVETVGQGFADEVFRVWQKSHPKIKLAHENANENVEFMIGRALALSSKKTLSD